MTGIVDTNMQASTMRYQQAGLAKMKGAVEDAAQQALKNNSGLDMEHIEETAQEFEAMFLTEMLRPMFEQVKPDPMFGGGKGEEVFQGLMLEEYGKQMAESGGIGLAEHVKAEMIRIQEAMQQ